METFVEYCKTYVKDHLNDFEGQTINACDLGYTLTEGPNANGTLTYSRAAAKDTLREWWNECGEFWEYEKLQFGEHMHNPFDEPEAYMVCMVIEGINLLLQYCQIISDNWNEEIELTEETISEILEQVDEQLSIDF